MREIKMIECVWRRRCIENSEKFTKNPETNRHDKEEEGEAVEEKAIRIIMMAAADEKERRQRSRSERRAKKQRNFVQKIEFE